MVTKTLKAEKEVQEVKVSYDYDVYSVQFTFGEEGVAASLPVSNSIRADYARLLQAGASNIMKIALGNKEQISEEDILAYLEKTMAVFPVDESGFYLREVQVISMLLNAATRCKLTVLRKGARSTLTQGTCFIRPKRLHLGDGDLDLTPSDLTAPAELTERESFVPNKQTGRSAIKSFQVMTKVKPISLKFYCLRNGDITPEDMGRLWDIAQNIGLGGCRRLGFGKFSLDEFKHE